MENSVCSKEKRILFWIAIIVTVILSYGFLVTQVSVGIDDEAYSHYFGNNALAAQGRVGYILIRSIANIYEFNPIWRESLGIFLLIGATIGCLYLFHKTSGKKISGFASVIFAVVTLSYPILADRFLFVESVFATPFLWLLCINGLFCLINAYRSVRKKTFMIYFLLSVCSIGFAMLFEKAILIVCVTIAFQIVIVMQLHEKSIGYQNSKTILQLLGLLIGAIIAATLLSIISTNVILKILHIDYSPYVEGYFSYDLNSPLSSLKNCFLSLKSMAVDLLKSNEAIHTFIIVFPLHLVLGVCLSIRKRNIWLLLCTLGYSILPFIPYIITANPYLPFRILDYWALWVGFAASMIFLYTTTLLNETKLKISYSAIKYVAIILCGVCVIRQSYFMTRIFYMDYRKYQKDVVRMEQIICDLQSTFGSDFYKPVLFLGLFPEYEEAAQNEIAGSTIFNQHRYWSSYAEVSSRRIYDFFSEHGYNLKKPMQLSASSQEFQDFQEEARNRVAAQEDWPKEGYIQEYPEYILVRLGPPLYQIYDISIEEFIEKYDTANSNIQGDVLFPLGDNSLVCYGWYVFQGENSWNTRISMCLLNEAEDRQYMIQLTMLERPGITEYFHDGFDYNNSGFQRAYEIDNIAPGTYQIGFLLQKDNKSQIIMHDRFYTVSN